MLGHFDEIHPYRVDGPRERGACDIHQRDRSPVSGDGPQRVPDPEGPRHGRCSLGAGAKPSHETQRPKMDQDEPRRSLQQHPVGPDLLHRALDDISGTTGDGEPVADLREKTFLESDQGALPPGAVSDLGVAPEDLLGRKLGL
jgi:hypothetical protein